VHTSCLISNIIWVPLDLTTDTLSSATLLLKCLLAMPTI